MDLKIGRCLCKDITNEDWILDNDACYQVMTRRRKDYSRHIITYLPLVMSKKLFAQLKKEGKIVLAPEMITGSQYAGCKAWRFNIENTEGKNGTE